MSWVTNIGYVQMDAGKLRYAEQSYKRALELARDTKSQQESFNSLRALAKGVGTVGKLDQANQCADEAIAIAQQSGNRPGGTVSAVGERAGGELDGATQRGRRDISGSEKDPKASAALIWGAQHALAQFHEATGESRVGGERVSRGAQHVRSCPVRIAEEDTRAAFRHERGTHLRRLHAFSGGAGQGRSSALTVADYSRARTLAEGLGRLRRKEHRLRRRLRMGRGNRAKAPVEPFFLLARVETIVPVDDHFPEKTTWYGSLRPRISTRRAAISKSASRAAGRPR